MKRKWLAPPIAFGAWTLGFPVFAQTPDSEIRQELTYLLRADAQALQSSQSQPASSYLTPAANAVMMSPYIVRESKNPDLPTPHYEPPIERFMRAGTIYTHVGKKVTSTLYFNIGGSDVPHSGAAPQSFRAELGWRISF